MQDLDARDPALDVSRETLPGHPVFLTPTLQGAAPESIHRRPVAVTHVAIAGNRVVVEESLNHRTNPFPLVGDRIMSATAEFPPQFLQRLAQLLAQGLALDLEAPLPVFATDVAET